MNDAQIKRKKFLPIDNFSISKFAIAFGMENAGTSYSGFGFNFTRAEDDIGPNTGNY